MTTTAPVPYNVDVSAKAWTDRYTVDQQTLLTNQTRLAASVTKGLGTLKTAISAYQSSLNALTTRKSMLAQAATFSNTAVGSATASATAATGTYSFFVERLASTNQISLGGLAGNVGASGTLTISQTGGLNGFTVDLSSADTDGAAGLSPKEIAAAINAAPHDSTMATASVITIGGNEQLVITSGKGGSAGALTLTASDPANAALQAPPQQLVAAQDAIIWLGAQTTGTKIEQGSNTFTGISGVSMSFTKAQAPGEAAFTMSVGLDTTATAANAQAFIDSYNKLKSTLDDLSTPGDPQKGIAAGPLAEDSGVRSLRDQMIRTLRENSVGALATYGISATRGGLLALDSTRLTNALKVNPGGLDTALGSNSIIAPSGVVGKLDKYLDTWSNTGTGQLAQRQASADKAQATLTKRQTAFEATYVATYNRYKAQFTKLNQLQAQMASNTDLFDSLFGSKN